MASTADIHGLRTLGQHLDALLIAVLAGDPIRAMIAAGRLRRAGYRACQAADAAGVAFVSHYINEKVQPALSLAWRVPGLTPQMYTDGLDHDQDGAPHLVGLQAREADLHETSWRSLHATDSDLEGACLRCAVLDNAVLEACTLDGTDLAGTSWRWAKVKACSLAGARLTNATLEYARFVDCDLRGADFSVFPSALAASWRATFVRCDLRGSLWHARSLPGAMFVDCKLEGARADDVADGADIDELDAGAARGSEDDGERVRPRHTRGRWMS